MNRIDREPARARRLEARLETHNQELGPRAFPVLVEVAIPVDRSLKEPFVPGEQFQYWPN